MHKPQGYTLIDVIAACLVVFILILGAALLFSNPYKTLEEQYDAVRQDDVRDFMEAMLELRENEPEVFWALVDELNDEAVMVGTGAGCGGPATVQECSQEMTCLDLTQTLSAYLDPLPSDPVAVEYSSSASGYYLLFSDHVLEIGACMPQQQDFIRLMAFIE